MLERQASSVLVVDMQERLLPAMDGGAVAVRNCTILVMSARLLGLSVAASEQYPMGLGRTLPELAAEFGNAPIFEKLAFSCWRDEALRRHLSSLLERGRKQIVVAGFEAHVCVLQTVLDLAGAGFAVFAVADAMASRTPRSAALAQDRMRQAGVHIITTEMAVFELLGSAGTPEFKSLSALIR